MQQRIQCGHRKPDGFSFPGINPHLGHLTRRHFLYRLQYRSRIEGCQPVFLRNLWRMAYRYFARCAVFRGCFVFPTIARLQGDCGETNSES